MADDAPAVAGDRRGSGTLRSPKCLTRLDRWRGMFGDVLIAALDREIDAEADDAAALTQRTATTA